MYHLVIRSEPGPFESFVSTAVLGLPVQVESAGWMLAFKSEFRIWINSPGESQTRQLVASETRAIRELTPLPLVAAGAVCCRDEFVVTGADENGRAVVLGANADGNVVWQHRVEGSDPIRWPEPACLKEPVVVWQTEHGFAKVARVTASGIDAGSEFNTGGPPLEIAAAGHSVWAVWSDASGVIAAEETDAGSREYRLATTYSSEVCVGGCSDGVCVAWAQGDVGYVVRKAFDHEKFGAPMTFELGEGAGGSLAFVSGGSPLVHARRARVIEGERPEVLSVLAAPGLKPFVIDGLVHSVARRDKTVAVLGTAEVLLLEQV